MGFVGGIEDRFFIPCMGDGDGRMDATGVCEVDDSFSISTK